MPYYRRRVRRSSRRSRIPPVGSIVNARTGRWTRRSGRSTRSMRSELGTRRAGHLTNPNQIYRVVFTQESHVAITNGQTESTAAQSLVLGCDFLATLYGSGNWAEAISKRFKTIRVKGFSLNREIFAMDKDPANYPSFINFVYRVDHDCAFGVAQGQSVTDMRTQQDVRHRLLAINDGARPISFQIKAFPKKEQLFIIQTDINPGAPGNLDYWDANFIMGLETKVVGADLSIWYRDTIELLYDGMESRY